MTIFFGCGICTNECIYMCVWLWVYVFTFVFPFLFCRPFRMLLVAHSWYFCIIFECYSPSHQSEKSPRNVFVFLLSLELSCVRLLLLLQRLPYFCVSTKVLWVVDGKVHGRVRADVGRGGGLVEWFVESFFLLPLLHAALVMWVWDIHTICPYLLIRMKRKQDKTKTKSIKIFP